MRFNPEVTENGIHPIKWCVVYVILNQQKANSQERYDISENSQKSLGTPLYKRIDGLVFSSSLP